MVSRKNRSRRNEGISNNYLVLLVFFAILVSIIGTWTNLNKITGRGPTDTGIVNVTVNTTISITLRDATVGVSSVNFTLNQGESDDTNDTTPAPFNVTNDGAVQVNITVNATKLFTSGSWPSTNFQGRCSNSSAGGAAGYNCTGNSTQDYYQLGDEYLSMDLLDWTSGNDTGAFDIAVDVPSGEPGGEKQSTVTFSAIDSALG